MRHNLEEVKRTMARSLEGGDLSAKQLGEIVHAPLPSIRRWLAQMAEHGEVFHYTNPDNSAVRIYTLDASKHKEDAYSRVKRPGNHDYAQGIIPGARVFLLDDPKRQTINRAIMLSQRTRTKVTAYPGTSWGDVALRMPFA